MFHKDKYKKFLQKTLYLVKLKRQPKQIIVLNCGCTYNGKWTLCNEAKRLLKESQRDFKNRNEYDLHFKELKNK